MRCKIGRTKAAVLPVPVWARPRMSRPSKAAGMAFSWMGVGPSKPRVLRLRWRSAFRPRDEKGLEIGCVLFLFRQV